MNRISATLLALSMQHSARACGLLAQLADAAARSRGLQACADWHFKRARRLLGLVTVRMQPAIEHRDFVLVHLHCFWFAERHGAVDRQQIEQAIIDALEVEPLQSVPPRLPRADVGNEQ